MSASRSPLGDFFRRLFGQSSPQQPPRQQQVQRHPLISPRGSDSVYGTWPQQPAAGGSVGEGTPTTYGWVPAAGATPGPDSVSSSSHPSHMSTSSGVNGSGAPASGPPLSQPVPSVSGDSKVVTPLTIERIETMLTQGMDYHVQRRYDDDGNFCLVGVWDDFTFIIEIPDEHDGWLAVAGDGEPFSAAAREEIGASVNDWNRERLYPTVSIVDSAVGPIVRAMYLVDLTDGVNDAQLHVHLDTALASCTHALSHVGPLLPEL